MKKSVSRFKYMTFEEIDEELDNLPCIWMKPYMLQSILRVRPNYKRKEFREKRSK